MTPTPRPTASPIGRAAGACHRCQRPCHLGEVLDEPPIYVARPEETAQVFLAPRRRCLLEPSEVLILHLQLTPAYDVAQILHLLLERMELLSLEGDARGTSRREYLPEVFHVLRRRLREDDDVV